MEISLLRIRSDRYMNKMSWVNIGKRIYLIVITIAVIQLNRGKYETTSLKYSSCLHLSKYFD